MNDFDPSEVIQEDEPDYEEMDGEVEWDGEGDPDAELNAAIAEEEADAKADAIAKKRNSFASLLETLKHESYESYQSGAPPLGNWDAALDVFYNGLQSYLYTNPGAFSADPVRKFHRALAGKMVKTVGGLMWDLHEGLFADVQGLCSRCGKGIDVPEGYCIGNDCMYERQADESEAVRRAASRKIGARVRQFGRSVLLACLKFSERE